ncbi:MAG: G1 family glutamic endopeptidase [Solirubrobacteraceae bacterium]
MRPAAAAIAISLGAGGCDSGSGAGAITSFGRMAGYVWSGTVTSVRAAWVVPKMASGTGAAHASTWIGAQAAGLPERSPFIQVGTTEDRAPTSGPAYSAFWTDTRRGFHPQILFHVHPGDRIAASMSLGSGRWRVLVADTTSRQQAVFSTREDADGAFTLAEWLQEDPSETSGRATPYPRLSAVRMSGLAVNGIAPRYADVYAQWMSVNGATRAPTPLHDDAFEITRGVITTAGRRYLQIAGAHTIASRQLKREEARWTPSTPARAIRSGSAAAFASDRAYARQLARVHWPAPARGPISGLVRQVRLQERLFATAARHVPASLSAWRVQLSRLNPALSRLTQQVQRALHLPELVPGQLPAARRGP